MNLMLTIVLSEYMRLEAERLKRVQRITEINDEVADLNAEISRHRDAFDDVNSERAKLKGLVDEKLRKKNELNGNINHRKQELRNLEQNKGNRLAMYGSAMVTLCQVVKREFDKGNFDYMPVGPLGQFITLKNNSAAIAVQACFGRMAHQFACRTTRDMNRLRQMARQVFRGGRAPVPNIIVQPFSNRRYDVEANKVQHSKYRSILDCITISDDYAFNVIVAATSADTVAFIPDEREATQLLLYEGSVPRNCTQAFTADGAQLFAAQRNKPFRAYPPDERRPPCMFSRDVGQQMEYINEQLRKLESELASVNTEGHEINEKLKAKSTEAADISDKIKQLQTKISALQREKDKLESIPSPEVFEIGEWEAELNVLKTKLEKELQQVDAYKNELQELNSKVREAESKLAEIEREKDEFVSSVDGSSTRKQDIAKLVKEQERRMKTIDERVAEVRADVDKLKAEKLQAVARAEQSRAAAVEIHPNAEECRTRKTREKLEHEIDKTKRLIEQRENEIGFKDEILAKFRDLESRVNTMEVNMNSVLSLVTTIDSSINKRKSIYKRFRKHITTIVCKQFQNCLEMMNYNGELIVHHTAPDKTPLGEKKAKSVEIVVNPRAKTSTHCGGDTRSLSGGERSFSTVALLLALWEHTYTPFKILDEVDVFMVSRSAGCFRTMC